MRNLYEVLGLSSSATSKDIKDAYKALALKYHPDKLSSIATKDDKSKFTDILTAYETLIDADKRHAYDNGVDPNAQHGGMYTYGDMGDIYDYIFKTDPPAPQVKRPDTIELIIGVTPKDILNGCEKVVYFDRNVLVDVISNVTVPTSQISSIIKMCNTCKGIGYMNSVNIYSGYVVSQNVVDCVECHATGYLNKYPSMYCIRKQKHKITHTICAGDALSRPITYKHYGHINFLNTADNGDIQLTFKHIINTNAYTIDEKNNLCIDKTISIFEALVGIEFIFEHPSGERMLIKASGPIPEYKVYHTYGLLYKRTKSHIVVTFNIANQTLTKQEVTTLKAALPSYFAPPHGTDYTRIIY